MAPLRDLSVILLAIEAMVLMLIPAIVIGASWYGVRWLRRKLSPILAQVRKYVVLVQVHVQRGSAAIVAPMIASYALAAGLRASWNFLKGLAREEN